ncbi:MAG: Ig-like domain-containing protein, partial [Planctomycetaceae bacterium]
AGNVNRESRLMLPGGYFDVWYDRVTPVILGLGPVTPAVRDAVVPSVDVTFSEPIDPATFDWHDVVLTRDGGANLATDAITVSAVPGAATTWRIGGLDALTALDGAYTLAVDACGVADAAGNAGTGTGSVGWTMNGGGSVRLSSVAGRVFHDLDGDGVYGADDRALAGWTVFLDADSSGAFGAGTDPTRTTDAEGRYEFGGLTAGTHAVGTLLPAGWSRSLPDAGDGLRTATVGTAATAGDVDFGAFLPGRLEGTLFDDRDADGLRDDGEPVLAGWTVFLDDDRDGALDAGERSTITDGTGAYGFADLRPGAHAVTHVFQPGWTQTSPGTAAGAAPGTLAGGHVVSIASGGVAYGLDFGNRSAAVVGPTATITSDRSTLKAGETATITFILSEESSDFTADDVSVAGGVLSDFAGSGTTFTAVFTPTTSFTGTGTVSVAPEAFTNTAGDGNQAGALAPTIAIDTEIPTAPGVALHADTGASASDLLTNDGTLALSAIEAGAVVEYSIDGGSTWTGAFSPAEGPNSVQVRQTDGAGNVSPAASLDFVLDTVVATPTVVLDSDTGASDGDLITKVGTIAVGGLETDAVVAYSTDGGVTWSDAFVAVEGPNSVTARQTDPAGNVALSAPLAFTLDTVLPTLAIASSRASLLAGQTATLTFTLSEAVLGFTADDVTVAGGTLSGFSGSGTTYTALFIPVADFEGEGTVSVAEGGFADAAGNPVVAATLPTPIAIDTLRPTVTIVPLRTDIRTGETAMVAFALSEDATDFTADAVTVTGGTLSGLMGSGRAYTAIFTPAEGFTGAGGIAVAAGRFTDPAGNTNQAGVSTALSIDTLAPTIKLASSLATLKSGTTAKVTFTLSKASTTFTLADVVATGGTLSAFAGTGAAYSATFTPQAGFTGMGTLAIAADAFTDSTGRGNAAGELAPAIFIDTVAPTLTITSDKATLKAGETATLTFTLSEPSSTFEAADVTVTGGTLSDFSGSWGAYTATFTPSAGSTRSGTVAVTARKFTDHAGNPNTAGALSPALSIDTVLPSATITASPATVLFGKTSKITFRLSEASTDFTIDDVAVSGGTLSNFTAVSPTSYWATFTPPESSTADGMVSVAEDGFTDAAGNGNVAASLATAITINTVQPSIAIAIDKTVFKAGDAATLTFTLSEDSSTFTVSDVTVVGGTLSGFTGSGVNYSAIFTPRANFTGDGAVSVAAGAFKSIAGNPNLAGSLAEVLTIDAKAPTLVLTTDKAALKAGESATITFTASEPIALDLANVTVGGGTLADLTGGGALYKATFTP